MIRFLVFLAGCTAGAAVNTEVFSGKAANEKGELEYVENHAVTYEDGKVAKSWTLYFDSNNGVIGEFVSEYLPSPQFSTYAFRQMRARYEDGVTVQGERWIANMTRPPGAFFVTPASPISKMPPGRTGSWILCTPVEAGAE